jgi:hypothetical protein
VRKLAFLVVLLAAAAEAAGYRGAQVEAVLEGLRADGVEILYSSDLVKPWMRVEHEPRATEPRAFLAEILSHHGIAVADGPGNTLMLVREPPRAPRHAAPGAPHSPAPAPIDAVVVSASHYQFGDESSMPPVVLGSAEPSHCRTSAMTRSGPLRASRAWRARTSRAAITCAAERWRKR